MFLRLGRLVAFIVALVVFAGPVPSTAQPATLTFEDPATDSLTLKELTRVSVRNRSDRPQEVVPSLRVVDNFDQDASDAFTVLPPPSPVPSGEVGTITIVRRTERVLPPDRRYSGNFTVRVPDGQVIGKTVQFSPAPAPNAAVVEPAVSSWAVTADRWLPLVDHTAHATLLPLKPFPIGPEPVLRATEPLGVLTDGKGHRVTVFGQIQAAGRSAHLAPGVKLSFVGLRGTGKYEGDIDLVPTDDEAGVVKLTLVQKDQWLFPFLTIVAGLGLAWLGQRWVGSRRHLGLLQAKATGACDLLLKQSCLNGVSVSNIGTAHTEAMTALTRLRDRTPVTIDPESAEFKKAVAAVDRLQEAADIWNPAAMGKAMTELGERLSTVDSSPGDRPPGSELITPNFLKNAKDLLKDSVKVEDVPSRLSDIKAAAELAKRWGNLQQRLHRLDELLD